MFHVELVRLVFSVRLLASVLVPRRVLRNLVVSEVDGAHLLSVDLGLMGRVADWSVAVGVELGIRPSLFAHECGSDFGLALLFQFTFER